MQLGIDGAFADYVEGLKFYYRFRRQNSKFPRQQVLLRVRPGTRVHEGSVSHGALQRCVWHLTACSAGSLCTMLHDERVSLVHHIDNHACCALQIFPQVSTATNATATL